MSEPDQLPVGIKETIQEGLNAISEKTEGFKSRPGQKKLIAETAKALYGCNGKSSVLVAEAPTGTGKGLAYLLGSIPVAQARDYTLVVSTATVALQEQLINYDLPILQQRAGLEFKTAIAKGRNRYVCNRNLANLTGSDERQGELTVGEPDAGAWTYRPSDEDRKMVTDMEAALEGKTEQWSGDLDQWGDDIPSKLRDLITTDRNGCLNKNCPFYSKCAYVNARREMFDADVIVANHSLVLKDLEMGGGKALTEPNKTFYVFDEGHHLNQKTLDTVAATTSVRGSEQIVEDLIKADRDMVALMKQVSGGVPYIPEVEGSQLGDQLIRTLKSAHSVIESILPAESTKAITVSENPDGSTRWRFNQGEVPVSLRDESYAVHAAVVEFSDHILAQKSVLDKAIGEKKVTAAAATKTFQSIGFLLQKLVTMESAWFGFKVDDTQSNGPPSARWIEWKEGARNSRGNYVISYSSTSASEFLKYNLFSEAAGVVITSATLTSVGNFRRMQENFGLRTDDGTQFLKIPSPFNYQEKGEFIIPGTAVDPKQFNEHTQSVVDYIHNQVDKKEGTLVLFASKSQMNAVVKLLRKPFRDMLLIQNTMPKSEIIAAHSKRISVGDGSIIFGLATFAEGIDLPGNLCTHVVIAKLPFSTPDSPVDATYAEYLVSKGRNPFIEVSVPDASVRLTQACGRLIRSESDHGRIAVLDRRLVNKPYGKSLINGLPPYNVRIEQAMRKTS